MNCNAGHTCSMRCNDPCDCPCEQARNGVTTNSLSLLISPAVVNELVTPASYPAVHSLQAELSGNAEIFDAAAWREWDAPKADGNANQSARPPPSKTLVIRDLHRRVDVSNGARKTGRPNAAILHSPPNIAIQVKQKQSPCRSHQPVVSGAEGSVHQPNENFPPAPPGSSPNLDTYATVAGAPNVPHRTVESTKVIASAQTNNHGQGIKKASTKRPSVFKSGHSYSGGPPPSNNTEPVASTQITTTTGPVPASTSRLFVSGVAEAESSASLKPLFMKYGTASDAFVKNGPANATSVNPNRFGFVTMAFPVQADIAISKLHGTRRHGQLLSVQRAWPHPHSTNAGPSNPVPSNPEEHAIPIAKSKKNNPGSEAQVKKNAPALKKQPKESDQVLTGPHHSPDDANAEHTPRQSNDPSDSNEEPAITVLTETQEMVPNQDDDLISFD